MSVNTANDTVTYLGANGQTEQALVVRPIGTGVVATASFTPAAAAYGAGDIMDVAKPFNFAAASGGELRLTNVALLVEAAALQASEAAYRLHLYSATPASARADNAVWDLPANERDAYLGFVDITVPIDVGSSLRVQIVNLSIQISVPASGIVFGELVTVAGFTATAVARRVTLRGQAL